MAISTPVTPMQWAKSSLAEFCFIHSTRARMSLSNPCHSLRKAGNSLPQVPSVGLGSIQQKSRHGKFFQSNGRSFRVMAMASRGGNFFESEPNFVDASVIEAVEVQSGVGGFVLRMADGKVLRCKHNDSIGARLLHYPPQPAMVLKMLDDSGLLLPILVGESSRSTLLQSLRNETTARPTIYAVILDMIHNMGYEPQLVRITHREKENYVGRLYITMVENKNALISLDIRPSDAINVAVKAQIPIQVAKSLAFSDGLRPIGNEPPFSFAVTKASKPTSPDVSKVDVINVSKEFNLVSSMELAIMEERYDDAAKIRDELNRFRNRKERKA